MSIHRKSGDGDAFLGAQRSEGERSEPERSGAPKNAADFAPPDPEVSERPARRRFSAAYKLKIVQEAERCIEHGQIGAMLRREGLYHSHLDKWRKLRDKGALHGLTAKKRGPKAPPVNLHEKQMKQLQRENARLQKKLAKAQAIIDFQKKVHALLGSPLPEMDEEERE